MWQELYQQYRGQGLELLSVAIDAQGPEAARPYVDQAGATFITVIDRENLLGRLFGFRAIPNGVLIDEQGVVRYQKFGRFDVRTPETRRMVEDWISTSAAAGESSAATELESRALQLFDDGLALVKQGDTDGAVNAWRQAVQADPGNYIIRKQLWALEHPEKFYAGEIDFAWQREQIEGGV